MPRRPRLIAAALATATVAAIAPATASAGLMSDCEARSSTPVFSPWLDYANYFLAPDGGFEHGAAGWTLAGASVVAGNNVFALSGAGASSVTLSAGDSMTSPSICVGLEHPSFRFVARRTDGSALSTLGASVILPDGREIPVGVMTGDSSWHPSPVMLVAANLIPTVTTDDSIDVQLRFAAESGSWQIDDVYVDPSGSR